MSVLACHGIMELQIFKVFGENLRCQFLECEAVGDVCEQIDLNVAYRCCFNYSLTIVLEISDDVIGPGNEAI